MTVLTPEHVARYALGAGWGIQDGTVATAVAMAESAGNTDAHATKGEDSRGLWQINVQAHPDLASQNLYDPATNAKVAFGIYKAQGWKPWSTHNSGAYLLWMPPATAAMALAKTAGPLGADAVNDTVEGAANSAAGFVADALKGPAVAAAIFKDLENPETWLRVIKVVAGAVLIIVGVGLVLRPILEPVAEQAAAVASKAAVVAA